MRALNRCALWVDSVWSRSQKVAGETGGTTVISPACWHQPADDDGFAPSPALVRAPRDGQRHRGLLPWYRTDAEFAEAVALCEAALASPAIETVAVAAPTAIAVLSLSPDDAALRFVEHLRTIGADHYGDSDLDRIYAEHCSAIGVDPLHKSVLREAMKWVPGVMKRKIDTKNGSGKRHRPFVWDVHAPMLARAA